MTVRTPPVSASSITHSPVPRASGVFGGVGDLEDGDLVPRVAQAVQGLDGVLGRRAPEIAHPQDQPASGSGSGPAAHGVGQGGRRVGGQRAIREVTQQLQEAVPPARRCPVGVRATGQPERHGGGAVEIRQREVRQTGDDAPDVVELARVAPIHRARAVEKQVDVQVFFLDEKLEHELPPARVSVPIDVPPIVAADEWTVLGKFHAGAARVATAFGALTALRQTARRQRERFEPGEERGVEQGVNGDGAHAAKNQLSFCQASRRPVSTRPIRSSASMPSACASKLSITRCRNTGSALPSKSSVATW